MSYESLTYTRQLPISHNAHYTVKVNSSSEVPGMINIEVWEAKPDHDDTRIYQFCMRPDHLSNMPTFGRFTLYIRRAIRTGIIANGIMPYNKHCFMFLLDPIDLQLTLA